MGGVAEEYITKLGCEKYLLMVIYTEHPWRCSYHLHSLDFPHTKNVAEMCNIMLHHGNMLCITFGFEVLITYLIEARNALLL
jgi:hypothetical protein